MTPYQAFVGEKPKVHHLRVFDCLAFAHVANNEHGKLDAKSRRCIFLGYSTEVKGYRLYDQKKSRVFFSRDVVFDESRMGVESGPTEQPTSSHFGLECDDIHNAEDTANDTDDNPVTGGMPTSSNSNPDAGEDERESSEL